jgi:hypothetical protein
MLGRHCAKVPAERISAHDANLGDFVGFLVLADRLVAEMGGVRHVLRRFDLVALYEVHRGPRREAGWARLSGIRL